MTPKHIVLLSLASLSMACGGAGQTVETDGAVKDVADLSADQGTPGDLVSPELARVDVLPLETVDLETRTEDPPICQPGDGCFGDLCQANADCLSGWCVDHMGDSVCSQHCVEECPPGWTCKTVSDAGPDVVSICVSDMANLCKPCATSEGCQTVAGADGACLDYGDEGSFCGGTCQADDDCPWGFVCGDAVTMEGVALTQCLAESGTCPCTDKAIESGLTTPCARSNEWGTCVGKRTCTEDGLSDCDAAAPAEEVCNGQDDNCDGDIDEALFVEGDYVNLCDDEDDCTKDLCLGQSGCQNSALTGTECSDEDPCTVVDLCQEGVCVGQPVDCEDDNPCTDDSCSAEGGCTHVANTLPCDDEDVCTVGDHCTQGQCMGQPVSCDCQADADCLKLEDGDLCNGILHCNLNTYPYQCEVVPESVVVCPQPSGPDAPCLEPACDVATGECSLVPAHEGAPCADGDACTVGDTCQQGNCQSGPDANCNDGNPCTDDTCDPVAGCLHGNNTQTCTDGNVCTAGDVCHSGVCLPGTALDCDDGNPCTDDACDNDLGCTSMANQLPCNDGNACTTGDVCQGGQCTFTGALACNDGNPCTDDSCDPATGCLFAANTAPCEDGSVCTMGDHCDDGACLSGWALPCNDNNACTDDSCNSDSGCVNVPNADPCAAAHCQDGLYFGPVTCADGACPQPEVTVCDYLCADDGGCYGECLPAAMQCDGLTPQLCDGNGVWQDQEPCPKGCLEGQCTDPTGPIQEGVAANPNLFVDESGQFVVIFNESDADFSNVRMATFAGTWQAQTIYEGYRIGAQAADRDADGTYHLVMGKFGESSVSYGTGPEPWTIDAVLQGIPTGGPTGTLDADGDFHISSSTSLKDRFYATSKSGEWASSKVASSSTGIASIAINGSNPPTIVYNQWNTRRIYVAEGPNFESGQTLIQSYGVDQGPPLSLKVFGGTKHLVYAYTHDYYTHYNVNYRTDATGSWQGTTLVASGPGVSGLDLTMDPAGKAHVIHCNADKDMLYHSNRTGGWKSTTLLDGTCGGGTLDTVFHNGKLYVVYRDLSYLLTLLEIDPAVLD